VENAVDRLDVRQESVAETRTLRCTSHLGQELRTKGDRLKTEASCTRWAVEGGRWEAHESSDVDDVQGSRVARWRLPDVAQPLIPAATSALLLSRERLLARGAAHLSSGTATWEWLGSMVQKGKFSAGACITMSCRASSKAAAYGARKPACRT
jgi:hypothetical protein